MHTSVWRVVCIEIEMGEKIDNKRDSRRLKLKVECQKVKAR